MARRSSGGPRKSRAVGVARAFDELYFGRERTLNLRASLPTPEDAVARAEAWLRERQAAMAGEVLLITGRGRSSEGGVSPVREAVVKRLASLRRRGVVARVQEHTPGSFAVTLAPMTALWDAPRRKKEPPPPPHDPPSLAALAPDIRALLRRLAACSLETLGVRDAERYLDSEMLRQFAALAAAIPRDASREEWLRAALRRAIAEYEDG